MGLGGISMTKLKRILSTIVSITMIGILSAGCGQKEPAAPMNIAALNGPTGMGLVKLMGEEKYQTSIYQSPDEIVGKIVNEEVDIACVPSNVAAVLYNKTQGGIKLLATNTLGVLYIVENGNSVERVEDLKGKTILASGKGSTPEFILNHLLQANNINPESDVTIEYYANHADIASNLVANEGAIALLPQPFVTTVLTKNENIKIAIDLNAEWEESEEMDLPMGTIIATKSFAEERKADLKTFLEDYKASVEFVNTNVDEAAKLVAEYEIVPNEAIAKAAIPKCNIVFRDSEESKESLNKFYEILSANEPKAVGGKIPDEAFFFEN